MRTEMSMLLIILDNIRYYVHFSVHVVRMPFPGRVLKIDYRSESHTLNSSEPEPVLPQHAVRWCTEGT
jgi:hypothetical protein